MGLNKTKRFVKCLVSGTVADYTVQYCMIFWKTKLGLHVIY
jgi:hypothetical protein